MHRIERKHKQNTMNDFTPTSYVSLKTCVCRHVFVSKWKYFWPNLSQSLSMFI